MARKKQTATAPKKAVAQKKETTTDNTKVDNKDNTTTAPDTSIEKLNETILAKDEEIKSLKATVKKLSNSAKKEKGVRCKTEAGTFEFSVKSFRFKGKKFDVKEAIKDNSLINQLIEAKASFLKPVQ